MYTMSDVSRKCSLGNIVSLTSVILLGRSGVCGEGGGTLHYILTNVTAVVGSISFLYVY
jgi:hypothetical protein